MCFLYAFYVVGRQITKHFQAKIAYVCYFQMKDWRNRYISRFLKLFSTSLTVFPFWLWRILSFDIDSFPYFCLWRIFSVYFDGFSPLALMNFLPFGFDGFSSVWIWRISSCLTLAYFLRFGFLRIFSFGLEGFSEKYNKLNK